MFGTIRRHQTWLWSIVIVVVIISFVVYFQPGQGGNNAGPAPDALVLNGKRVTPQMMNAAKHEVRLIYFLNNRKWPEEDPQSAQYDFDTDAIIRLFRTAKAEEAGITVSDQTLKDMAQRFLGGAPFDQVMKELAPRGITPEIFESFLRNEAMAQQLGAIVGAAGRMVTPAEAEAIYRRENQAVGGDIVFLNITNYLSKVVITNGALTNWYNMRGYRTPEKVQVGYIEFSYSNHLAEAEKRFSEITNLQQQLREMYYKAGPANFKDTNGVQMTESNALARIREVEMERLARTLSARQANEFANKLYDKLPLTAPAFAAIAASNNLQVKLSEPFDRENGPTNLDVSGRFIQAAFSLSPTNAVSVQPIEGEHGFYIVSHSKTFPSEPEPYNAIKARVEEDYRRYQAYTLAVSAATNFVAQATNGVAQGKTFEEVALKNGLKVETLPPISAQTHSVTNIEERLDLQRLKNVMLSMEPNKVSSFIQNPPHGGYVVYVRGKLPLDEAKVREELPRFVADLRLQKQNELFTQWFRKQVEQAKLPLPNRQNRPTRS